MKSDNTRSRLELDHNHAQAGTIYVFCVWFEDHSLPQIFRPVCLVKYANASRTMSKSEVNHSQEVCMKDTPYSLIQKQERTDNGHESAAE